MFRETMYNPMSCCIIADTRYEPVAKKNFITFRPLLLAACVILSVGSMRGQSIEFMGQVSSWGMGTTDHADAAGAWGIRYIPQVNVSDSLNGTDLLNAEFMVNAFYSTDFHSDDRNVKAYRAIVRYTTTQTETQLGLQKINFGPAQLLRPLMWFDKTDPRDPLKLTDGVYGLRYKYSFMDNALFWAWCLYGNTETKGYERWATADKTPEVGGRLQLPLVSGEIGATVHTRKAVAGILEYREGRYALDGRWDIGIGLWFESVVQKNTFDWPQGIRTPQLLSEWNRTTTIGGDYTIPAGNGIYVLAEHMVSSSSSRMLTTDTQSQLSALMMTYPVGVLDNLMLQEYFSWSGRSLYHFCQWQRTYDNVIIAASLFHYPSDGGQLFPQDGTAPAAGYGAQLMVVYNY
jgi:hypothetical protein